MIPDVLTNYLFIDIETVRNTADFNSLDEKTKKFWIKKALLLEKNVLPPQKKYPEESYLSKSGIFAEFSRVICISVGAFFRKNDELYFKVKSFKNENECDILTAFFTFITEKYGDNEVILCGHNIREFDIPFICRRALIYKMRIPELLNFMGKKPWEVTKVIDTMEIWKFGDYKNFTSLDLLAHLLGIPSPKSDLSGEKVGAAYWEEGRLNDIVKYCEKDVITTGRLIQRILGMNFFEDDKIVFIRENRRVSHTQASVQNRKTLQEEPVPGNDSII